MKPNTTARQDRGATLKFQSPAGIKKSPSMAPEVHAFYCIELLPTSLQFLLQHISVGTNTILSNFACI